MKSVRLFVISSSLVLAAWLGASFFSQVKTPATVSEGAAATSSADHNADGTDENKAPLPVAHVK
ncbi:hypothetical protein NT6N_20430 [Oceaniferula spumae]|uniref:Efflux transporter periplasmic adaptor subunit n=1 Tax=Oceaniferula spumae TaxID=2979115 RepID=A0AAT9FM24_9BACT